MDPVSNIVGQVIHYVYTWLPKTAKNDKEQKKNSRQCKKRVNFSQPLKEKSEIYSYHTPEEIKSTHGLPSVPNGSKIIMLHSLANGCEGERIFSQEFPSCNLEVVGYKFLSNEKKVSKRSALKRWLRQRTNVVRNENFHLDERCYGRSHDLCCREVFECSPRFADSRYQRGHVGLKGKRRLPQKQWPRDTLDRTVDEELNGCLVDLHESLSVIRVWPSYEYDACE